MRKSTSGFTIVELLIVIVVIAILAAISVVAYSGIQNRARESTLKTALSNAGKWMQTEHSLNGSYPTSLSGFRGQDGIALSLSSTTNGFCINGEFISGSPLTLRNESAGGIQEGLCSGAVISGSESGVSPNLVTNTDFSSGWSRNFASPAGRTLSTRPGAPGDPYPNRPVLVLTNSGTASTTWSVIHAGINYAAIENGRSYALSMYARKIGPFSGSIAPFGILNSSGGNVTITYQGGNVTMTDSWQKISKTSTATRRETNDQVIYLALPPSAFTTSGWQLEFQGFEIREA